DGFVNAFYKTVCHLSGFLASVSLFNLADYGITRAAGDRRSSHCAAAHCLMYLLAFCFIQTCAEVLHNFFVAAYAACARITAGNDLAEDRDIGINAIITLRTGKADTETCNNLITNKQRAVFAAERLNALREVLSTGRVADSGPHGSMNTAAVPPRNLLRISFLARLFRSFGKNSWVCLKTKSGTPCDCVFIVPGTRMPHAS